MSITHADEARELTDSYKLAGLCRIMAVIEKSATSGETVTFYATDHLNDINAVMIRLKENGFLVSLKDKQLTIKW
jgi:hypothetical protein